MVQCGGCSIRPPGRSHALGPRGGGGGLAPGQQREHLADPAAVPAVTLGQAPAASGSSGPWGRGKGKAPEWVEAGAGSW